MGYIASISRDNPTCLLFIIDQSTSMNMRMSIEKTKAQFPRRLPTGWQISAESRGNQFIMSVDSPAPVHAAAFFPSEPGVIENAAPQRFVSSKRGFRLTLEKSQQLVKPPTILEGVIVLDSGAAYSVSSPL